MRRLRSYKLLIIVFDQYLLLQWLFFKKKKYVSHILHYVKIKKNLTSNFSLKQGTNHVIKMDSCLLYCQLLNILAASTCLYVSKKHCKNTKRCNIVNIEERNIDKCFPLNPCNPSITQRLVLNQIIVFFISLPVEIA